MVLKDFRNTGKVFDYNGVKVCFVHDVVVPDDLVEESVLLFKNAPVYVRYINNIYSVSFRVNRMCTESCLVNGSLVKYKPGEVNVHDPGFIASVKDICDKRNNHVLFFFAEGFEQYHMQIEYIPQEYMPVVHPVKK